MTGNTDGTAGATGDEDAGSGTAHAGSDPGTAADPRHARVATGDPLPDGGDPDRADPDGGTDTDPATPDGGADPDRADPDGTEGPAPEDRTVVAQGTFDVLHPGHVHYLRAAAGMGDHLTVIIARRSNVTHKEPPVIPDEQRREMVAALDPVDRAILGDPEDIFVPIERIRPDVIALGHDQHHDPEAIRTALAERGIDCAVRRASGREPRFEGELLSTNDILERIIAERGD